MGNCCGSQPAYLPDNIYGLGYMMRPLGLKRSALRAHRGKVVVVVTGPRIEAMDESKVKELESFYETLEKYLAPESAPNALSILLFPSDDFAQKAEKAKKKKRDSHVAILSFDVGHQNCEDAKVQRLMKVAYVSERVHVLGFNGLGELGVDTLLQYLKEKLRPKKLKGHLFESYKRRCELEGDWSKFVIDKNGVPVKRYSPDENFSMILEDTVLRECLSMETTAHVSIGKLYTGDDGPKKGRE